MKNLQTLLMETKSKLAAYKAIVILHGFETDAQLSQPLRDTKDALIVRYKCQPQVEAGI